MLPAIAAALLLSGCAKPMKPADSPPSQPEGIFLTIQNLTDQKLGVYFIEQRDHTRLGAVEPRTDGTLLVRYSLLAGRTRFRVYAFRGPEPCPVARVIDLGFSLTPRITVTARDTVVSGYSTADACRAVRN